MRWHTDLIESGTAIEPLDAKIAARRAQLTSAIEQSPRTTLAISQGATLLVDNHYVLHGRTALRDPDRLLRRVKLARMPECGSLAA